MLNGKVANALEAALREHVERKDVRKSTQNMSRLLNDQIAENQKAIDNLGRAIASAADIESLIPLLRKAEGERRELLARRHQLSRGAGKGHALPSGQEIGRLVADFLLRFESVFAGASAESKRLLFRQWIERIDVFDDNPAKKVRAYIRLIPRTAEYDLACPKFVLCGPCRT